MILYLIGGTRPQDAVDALVDGLTLSLCDGLVHIDSSVSMFAAFRSPSLKLHNAGRLIPPSQETMISDEAPRRLRVVNESGVFIRAEPTVASAALNYKRKDEILDATGKTSGKWAEVGKKCHQHLRNDGNYHLFFRGPCCIIPGGGSDPPKDMPHHPGGGSDPPKDMPHHP